jgi:SAM-dependent methyltransferase
MPDADIRSRTEAAVKACYSTWAGSYHADYYADAGAYPPVHLDIIRKLLRDSGARNVVDAGCGPASMLRDLTNLGLDLYGFDLTPEMVSAAREVMASVRVPADHLWEGSVAERSDFCKAGVTPDSFDAAICIGVFPHLPESIETDAIANLRAAVKPGGLVAIEARNQLFGLFSLNRYSYDLFVTELMRVPELREAGFATDALNTVTELMKAHFRMDLPPVRAGKTGEPGYDQVSRTHNPFTLRQKFEAAGFRDAQVFFYHYHCLPPMFEQSMPAEYRRLSVAMEDPFDWRGHFMASAFILAGTRQ